MDGDIARASGGVDSWSASRSGRQNGNEVPRDPRPGIHHGAGAIDYPGSIGIKSRDMDHLAVIRSHDENQEGPSMQPISPAAIRRRVGHRLPTRTNWPNPYCFPIESSRAPDAWDRLLIWLSSGTAAIPQALDHDHLVKGVG